MVPNEDQNGDEPGDADHHPGQLGGGGDVLVLEGDALNHRQAEAVERHRDRQDHRVGVGGEPANDQVRHAGDSRQPEQVAERVRRYPAEGTQVDRDVRRGRDADREQQQGQLGAPAAPWHVVAGCAHWSSGQTSPG